MDKNDCAREKSSARTVGIFVLIASVPLAFIGAMARLAERFAFGTQVPVGTWIERLDTPTVWIFFFIIFGLLVMSYVLKAVEWAILARKVV